MRRCGQVGGVSVTENQQDLVTPGHRAEGRRTVEDASKLHSRGFMPHLLSEDHCSLVEGSVIDMFYFAIQIDDSFIL